MTGWVALKKIGVERTFAPASNLFNVAQLL